MRRIVILVLVLLVVCGASFAGGAREKADAAAIARNLELYIEYVEEGDAEAWLELHEPQAYKMPQNQPMFTIESVSNGAQEERFAGMQAAYEVSGTIDPTDIRVDGDLAYAMGVYTIDMAPRGDAPPNGVDGKFLTVFRRQEDGSWKIWRDCYNSNVAPAK